MKRYITKNKWKRKIKEEHKKYGFLKGLPFAEIMPPHWVYDWMRYGDGTMSWMMQFPGQGNYTVLAYPSKLAQREVRKRLKEIDPFYKLFMYYKIKNKYGKRAWNIPATSYGFNTGIKDFLKVRDGLIQDRVKHYREIGNSLRQALRNTQIDLKKLKKQMQKLKIKWEGKKRDPYTLSISAIAKIVHTK